MPVKDLTYHFTQYWNFILIDKYKRKKENQFLNISAPKQN